MSDKPLDSSDMLESSDDFEAIYQSHAPTIQRFLYWRTHNTQLSEDLTSNVFEKAWRSRDSFHTGSVQAWLYHIARNVLIDHWRKKQDLPVDDIEVLDAPASDIGMGEALDNAQLIEQLQQAVERLPRDMRSIVTLRFIQGLSCKQVAAQLHLSESNVRVIQYRALKRLRGYLQ